MCAAETTGRQSDSDIGSDELIADIVSLTEEAIALQRNGEDRKAIPVFEEALRKSNAAMGGDDPFVASLQRGLGSLYQAQGNFAKALELYDSSLAIREKAFGPDHPEVANTLNGLASLCRDRGDYARAVRLYGRSLSILEKEPEQDHAAVSATLDGLAQALQTQGDFPRALSLYERSLKIVEQTLGAEDPQVAIGLNNLAEFYREQANFEKALALYQRSLQISKKALNFNHPETATTLNNLALLYQKRGDYAEALRLFQQSLEIRERLLGDQHTDVAASLGNIGRLYRELGDIPQALSMHRRSLAVMENAFSGDHSYVAQALMDLGITLDYGATSSESISLYRRALAMRERVFGQIHPEVADSLDTLGSTLEAAGNYAEALPLLERSLEIRRQCFGETHARVAETLAGMGILYQRLRDFQKAEALYERSLDIAEKTLGTNSPTASAILENSAVLAVSSGKTRQGVVMFQKWFSRWRFRQASELSTLPEKYAFLSATDNLDAISRLHSVGAADRESIPVCANQLAFGKAFLEEVQAAQTALEADPQVATHNLREQHQDLQMQLVRLSESGLPLNEREAKRLELQNNLGDTESRLAERSKLVAQAIRERNQTLTEIARTLPRQSVLVDFINYTRYDFRTITNLWKEHRYAAYLTFPLTTESTNLVVERIDLGEASVIDAAVSTVMRRMSAGQYRARDLKAAIEDLDRLVYAPLAQHLTNVSHLIVCPDGQLNLLPFEMLRHNGRYLIEDKTISYVTSGREVLRLAQPRDSAATTSAPLVMGNPDFDLDLGGNRRELALANGAQSSPLNVSPESQSLLTSAATRMLSRDFRGNLYFTALPGAELEATNVAMALGSETILRIGPDARESELKQTKSPRVLHLATHGFFLPDQERQHPDRADTPFAMASDQPWKTSGETWENPMIRCGLALAGANHAGAITNAVEEDGILTGLEAALLDLQGTELVILSACDSGSGDVKIGEGVMSLRRAFRIAGAETVLASHWPVDDKATSQLMTEFMRRWQSGESRAEAWRGAQLSLLHSKGTGTDFSDPHFWAAFTLTGDWRQ